jgi:hypothetical protein
MRGSFISYEVTNTGKETVLVSYNMGCYPDIHTERLKIAE